MSDHMEHSLDDELRAIEAQLANLEPSALPSDMLNRMGQLANQWSESEQAQERSEQGPYSAEGDLNELEVHLGLLSPAAMPDDMLSRMSQAMDRWHEHVPEEEKVVPFGASSRRRPQFFHGRMLSAAAAVAVLGAASALVMPRLLPSRQGTLVNGAELAAPKNNSPSAYRPARSQNSWQTSNALSHKVTRTSDRGVILSDGNQPLRCIRVDYIDRINGKDTDGREIEIKTPGVNFMLIPVETN